MTTINQEQACCSSCGSAADDTALAIACTLDSHGFKGRVAEIRELASLHLLSSRRDALVLRLTYDAVALSDVEALVAKESSCCSFLEFNIEAGDQVELTITAPEQASLAADELFAHFAPELARAAA
jgi:hypothetical protein